MRKWLIGAICAMSVAASTQDAKAFSDGHALLEAAESEDTTLEAMFVMYVAGVLDGVSLILDGHELPQFYCISDGITRKDAGDAVRIWLRSNPQHLDFTPTVAVLLAIQVHFPCETD